MILRTNLHTNEAERTMLCSLSLVHGSISTRSLHKTDINMVKPADDPTYSDHDRVYEQLLTVLLLYQSNRLLDKS